MTAYYNEIDPYAAQWLRNLIDAGHIAPGDVDERSIVDVRADDLRGYTQCHFFAGNGGWSRALRLAGWDDDRPVWTGSCPCQPFSSAGAGKAADDERHLWPAWFSLISECGPPVVFGEQVEAAIGWGWLDVVCSNLEGKGYACGTAILPACGVGAPHIRQRAWFVADTARSNQWRHSGKPRSETGSGKGEARSENGDAVGSTGSLVYSQGKQMGFPGRTRQSGSALGNADFEREAAQGGFPRGPITQRIGGPWAEAEWIECRDGKSRPVEPGTFPLAHGIPCRVGRLRSDGNAIVPQVAAEFIGAAMTTVTPADGSPK